MSDKSVKDKDLSKVSGKQKYDEAFWEAAAKIMARSAEKKQKYDVPQEILQALVDRPISTAEVDHLLEQYAYLEICNADARHFDTDKEPTLIRSESGWLIHDYGDLLVASSGLMSYGHHPEMKRYPAINDEWSKPDPEEGDGGAGEEPLIPEGNGTIVQQFTDTAKDMVALAQERWTKGRIRSGYTSMQRMAWIIGLLNRYPLDGFEPNNEDKVVLVWAKRNGMDRLMIQDTSKLKPKPQPGR